MSFSIRRIDAKQAQNLVSRFKENFKKFGEDAQQLEAAGGFKG
ncbi:hypothetical protein QS430_12485 [Staphylococcus pseudintermedius]|nr:hypothetical protein QS430_12485 [Staphylococcus pseudintermedius]